MPPALPASAGTDTDTDTVGMRDVRFATKFGFNAGVLAVSLVLVSVVLYASL